MSKLLIQNYLANLSKLRQVGGTHREGVVSEAFKDLLKGWALARSHLCAAIRNRIAMSTLRLPPPDRRRPLAPPHPAPISPM